MSAKEAVLRALKDTMLPMTISEISERCELYATPVGVALSTLCKENVIDRVGRGIYQFNAKENDKVPTAINDLSKGLCSFIVSVIYLKHSISVANLAMICRLLFDNNDADVAKMCQIIESQKDNLIHKLCVGKRVVYVSTPFLQKRLQLLAQLTPELWGTLNRKEKREYLYQQSIYCSLKEFTSLVGIKYTSLSTWMKAQSPAVQSSKKWKGWITRSV